MTSETWSFFVWRSHFFCSDGHRGERLGIANGWKCSRAAALPYFCSWEHGKGGADLGSAPKPRERQRQSGTGESYLAVLAGLRTVTDCRPQDRVDVTICIHEPPRFFGLTATRWSFHRLPGLRDDPRACRNPQTIVTWRPLVSNCWAATSNPFLEEYYRTWLYQQLQKIPRGTKRKKITSRSHLWY